MSLAFFTCSRDPPSTHCFPTRRSSDLSGAARKRRCACPKRATARWSNRRRSASSCSRRTAAPFTSTRSEEHTSELQSPCNLVCRLLLEQKKTAAPKHRNPQTARRQHPL